MKHIKNTSSNKKIALIGTTAASVYGFRRDLIKELCAENYMVYAFVSEYSKQCLEKISELGAIPVTYNLSRGGLNPWADLKTIKELKSKLSEIHPDVVLSYFTKPVIYGTLAAKSVDVPRIVGMLEGLGSPFTFHKNGQNLKMRLIRLLQVNLYRFVFPFLDKIVFLNPDDPIDLIQKHYLKHKINAIEILGPIGLNLKEYSYCLWNDKTSVSFIFIARLIAEKGVFEYIEAAKLVKKKYPNVIFKMIGGLDAENPYGLSQDTLDQIISLGIVEYPGYVEDVETRIKNSAVFVLPSYYREGVPRSTQEAMAIGRPVITTNVPGCRETVIDGVNGFLVPKWDAEALAERMCFFVENPEQVNLMGQESYRIAVDKFDARKANQKLFAIMGLSETNEKIG